MKNFLNKIKDEIQLVAFSHNPNLSLNKIFCGDYKSAQVYSFDKSLINTAISPQISRDLAMNAYLKHRQFYWYKAVGVGICCENNENTGLKIHISSQTKEATIAYSFESNYVPSAYKYNKILSAILLQVIYTTLNPFEDPKIVINNDIYTKDADISIANINGGNISKVLMNELQYTGQEVEGEVYLRYSTFKDFDKEIELLNKTREKLGKDILCEIPLFNHEEITPNFITVGSRIVKLLRNNFNSIVSGNWSYMDSILTFKKAKLVLIMTPDEFNDIHYKHTLDILRFNGAKIYLSEDSDKFSGIEDLLLTV